MKHAYLIMAHDNFEQLCLLLNLIDDIRNDIYVHIDRKSMFDEKKIKQSVKFSQLYFLSDRIDVRWGQYSQIEVELLLLETAINKKYEYLHLISGRCLPLVNQDKIHKFFLANKGKEFVAIDGNDVSNLAYRYKYYYNYLKFIKNPKKKFWKMCMVASNAFQKIIGVNRCNGIDIEIKKGSQWFSITDEFANYVLGKKEWIYEHFKDTLCCDEFFLQTIIWNSPFAKRIYDNPYGENNMRLVDWKRGSPYTFRIEDYDEIMNSNRLFARKFDINCDREIVEKIYNTVLESSSTTN